VGQFQSLFHATLQRKTAKKNAAPLPLRLLSMKSNGPNTVSLITGIINYFMGIFEVVLPKSLHLPESSRVIFY
jgi:hypothetical protein